MLLLMPCFGTMSKVCSSQCLGHSKQNRWCSVKPGMISTWSFLTSFQYTLEAVGTRLASKMLLMASTKLSLPKFGDPVILRTLSCKRWKHLRFSTVQNSWSICLPDTREQSQWLYCRINRNCRTFDLPYRVLDEHVGAHRPALMNVKV